MIPVLSVRSAALKLVLLFLITALVLIGSLFVGPVWSASWQIIWDIRLPRTLLALIVGSGLAAAGATFQGVLRNPLADPFILGTSSAAAAGVMMSSVMGFDHYSALYSLSLGFALLSIFLVYRIAQMQGRAQVQTLVLTGVVVSLFFNAAVFLVFSIFYRESFTTLFYLLGSLTEGEPTLILVSSAIIVFGFVVTWLYSRELNLMTQGEEAAQHLGVEVERIRKILFVAASAMVAAAVAVAGMIGFVGLIVPHMMRIIMGPDHRILLPASALGGAVFLLLADGMARTAIPPLEIPVGAITALIGSPYFIYLLRRRHMDGQF